jgi:hypothetical protein
MGNLTIGAVLATALPVVAVSALSTPSFALVNNPIAIVQFRSSDQPIRSILATFGMLTPQTMPLLT